ALASYDRALAIKPDDADALYNRGIALRSLKRFEEALANYDRALAAKPDQEHAFSGVADCVVPICDWSMRGAVAGQVRDHIVSGTSVIRPFLALRYLNDQALLRRCAETFVKKEIGNFAVASWRGDVWRNDRIKIAYLSADFHRHATAYLMAE